MSTEQDAEAQGPYTFDMVAIVTISVATEKGQENARQAAEMLTEIDVRRKNLKTAFNVHEVRFNSGVDAVYELRCIAPRGRAWLVRASDDAEHDALEEFDEPLPGSYRKELTELVADWSEATGRAELEGTAGALVRAVTAMLAE